MNKVKYRETILNLKRTWKYVSKQKKSLFFYFLVCLIAGILGAVVPVFLARQLLHLTGGLFDQLIFVSIIVFILQLSKGFFFYLTYKCYRKFFTGALLNLQDDLINHTLKLEIETIDKNSSGVFIDRINQDSSDVVNMVAKINELLTSFLSDMGILVAIYIVNKYIFIYFIIFALISFTIDKIRLTKFYKTNREVKKLNENNKGLVSELVRGIRDIKILNASNNFRKKMNMKLLDLNQRTYEMYDLNKKYIFFVHSVQYTAYLGFMLLVILLIKNNVLTIASAVLLHSYQSRIFNLFFYFSLVFEELKKFNLSANRIYEVIYSDEFTKEKFGTVNKKKIHGDFEFKNVTFSYKNNIPVLKNISFKVNANETVAFVGKSGSGKSTIFSLITKLYNVNSGIISIDGTNIKDLNENSLRGNISMINQFPYIFNFTIRENLKVVNETLTEKEMMEACKLAEFHDFVMSLPDGYDTLLGEGGLNLSGGQRQRLAIARALIKKTEIILFDEATSALDNETQEKIQRAINNMKNKYTILIIAHRLSTVVSSDRIILMDDGKVLAEGSHSKLLKENKIYKKLYDRELITRNK